uniref:Large ribosomal subunit protein bL32c n=1 Tax=Actinostachys pennula TaxID=148577 RepID=A0A1U7AFL6_9MONI|nr:ribosomal protein L32 [Actinostachys pennula]AOV84730.1 ribosomal protein L32 [Actinostachys pennula]
MAVPKKRTSRSKKKIRNHVWKTKVLKQASKAFSLAKSVLTGGSKSFYYVVTGKRLFETEV